MLVAKATVKWTNSVSGDVKSQHVTMWVNDVEVLDTVLGVDASSASVTKVKEGDKVAARVVVNDGTFDSDAADSVSFVPDLSKPVPVTDLSWEFSEVEETEE